jgi:hypothetical protein
MAEARGQFRNPEGNVHCWKSGGRRLPTVDMYRKDITRNLSTEDKKEQNYKK